MSMRYCVPSRVVAAVFGAYPASLRTPSTLALVAMTDAGAAAVAPLSGSEQGVFEMLVSSRADTYQMKFLKHGSRLTRNTCVASQNVFRPLHMPQTRRNSTCAGLTKQCDPSVAKGRP